MNQDTRLDNRIIDIRVSGGSHCGAWRCECADSGLHGGVSVLTAGCMEV